MDIKYKIVNGKQYIDNWFSNMLPLDKPYIYQGIEYKTAENFYQAMKLPKTEVTLRREIAQMNPFLAKKATRNKIQFPEREDWESDKLKVMDHILRVKFAPGTSWAQKLLATEKEEIIEWNNWGDTWWGRDVSTKVGKNNLGVLLMKIRADLRDAI